MDDEIFENTKSKARDLLMCGLCGGTYLDPRRLPCDHSFCRRCLQTFHDSIRNNERSIRLGSFHCPACSAQIGIPHGGVSGFPVDDRIGDIKEKVVGEMEDILRKKLLAKKGMSGSSFDSFGDNESQNSDAFSEKGTRRSHETEPPTTHQGKSRTFGRYQTFTDFDARQKRSETCDASAGRPRFDRQRPMYSSLRETHRRKAQDLMAAFNLQGSSQTDEFLSRDSTSREAYHDTSSETRYPTDHRRSFNNSSRFRTHHTEDIPHRFSSRNSRNGFADSESTTTGSASSFSNAPSASGYSDDRNSAFLRNHRGYESLREKGSRRTYLGEDTFTRFAGKTAEESKFQETNQNFGGAFGRHCTQETDSGSVPLFESDSVLGTATADRKTSSGRKSEYVSDPCLTHTKGNHEDFENLGDVKFADFKRPAETVVSHDQNGEIPDFTSMSQPPFRRTEDFAGLKRKPPSGRTKLFGSFISPLATAHEEERGHFHRTVGSRKMSFEESAPPEETRNNTPRHPADFTNTSTSSANPTPKDLISKSNCVKSGMNSKQTLDETFGKITNVSGKVPSKNLNNSMGLEDEVEVMQEFDFLLSELNEEEEEIDADSEQDNDDNSAPINSAINKRNLPEEHREHPGKISCNTATTTTSPPANATVIAEKNGFAENGTSNRGAPRNGVTVESCNGIEGSLPSRTDNEKAKEVTSGETMSSLHNEDNVKIIHDDSNGTEAADADDDDDEDEDTLVNGKASEEEDNCFDQSPRVSSSTIDDDNADTTFKTRYLPRVNRHLKKTINKGTATLHHISPEVYLMPTGVATLSQGSTVVADHGIGCLQYYASDGSPLHRIEGVKPFSIAVNLTNNQVIVGDRRRKTVCLYDEYGCDVAQWDENMFKWICGIGILSSGDLVILDREKSQIGIYKPNGVRVHTFGSYGNDDSQLCMAEFLVVDGNDRIVVSDSGNHCIKVFSVEGTLLGKFGQRGCKDGEFQWPKGVCTDDANNIIVADACNSRVSMFSCDGRFLQHLVTNITMPYAVSYSSPNVAVTRYSVMGQSQFLLYSVADKS